MSPNTSSPADLARRAFLKIDEATILTAVDSLDLRGHAKITAVVGMPLRNLQQRRDVAAFATTAPLAAVKALLELLAMAPLEKVVEALGEHADSPTYEQLAAAVDQLTADGTSSDDLVALLAFAISEAFPASAHCRRLLDERPEFSLPDLPEVVVAPSLLAPREVDPQVREQRRQRREEEKKRKKGPSSVRPPRPVKAKPVEKRSVAASPSPVPTPPEERRRMFLTPAELDRFSPDHPLVGTVVLVEVPFDAVDPATPEVRSKERPALVVAANEESILVRAIYSSPLATRHLFKAWRRIGLDHVSYVDDSRIVVTTPIDVLTRLGQLSDPEWNALL